MKVGIDIVETKRFEGASDELTSRLFTPIEIAYCQKFSQPHIHFAGIFAAKEATMKALGLGLDTIPFKNIQITHEKSGAPKICLFEKALGFANLARLENFEISISHTNEIATAICIAN